MTEISIVCFCEVAFLNCGWMDATTWPSKLWVKALSRSTTRGAGVGGSDPHVELATYIFYSSDTRHRN
jgi:hypothetical protein